ncbi:MAG: BrnT family toxin [Betaproteobacteria bacterium]|nr:BrnT family toxin [Betaproteobacteria bacterium]
MHIEFDPDKNSRNIEARGLSFEHAADFDFETAIIWEDLRKAYPERRFVAVGFLESRLHVLAFSPKAEGIRVISFRKANPREVRTYEKAAATPD